MEVTRIADGLWRWTARHPEWKPGEGWEPDVGCVYYEDPEVVVLIDPLVPAGKDEPRFWRALDRDVGRQGLPVVVLLTSPWHERSKADVEARYGVSRVVPAGVQAFPVAPDEDVFWIPDHGALVIGDALLDTPEGLRLQPAEWVEGDYRAFVAAMQDLTRLPIEHLLPSHGEPVLANGREALAQAHSSSATAT